MNISKSIPRSVVFSCRIYRLLLGIYPSEFRREYGGPMQQVFRDCLIRADREDGSWGLVELWARTMLDTVAAAIEEHLRRGVDMSREKFYKLSGWALLLGPLLFLMGGWATNQPQYSPYNAATGLVVRFANLTGIPMVVLGLSFISLGLLSLMLRFSPRLDATGILLGIASLAGLVCAVGAGMSGFLAGDYWETVWWYMFELGMIVQYIALVIFGFISLRRKILPRWNGLPMLALWLPAVLVLSLALGPIELTGRVLAALWIFSVLMFAGLGYLLVSGPLSSLKSEVA